MLKRLATSLIRFYKHTRSARVALLGVVGIPEPTCIYTPTCSEYTQEAIQKYGVIKGSAMGFKRFLRCRPGMKGGWDPVK